MVWQCSPLTEAWQWWGKLQPSQPELLSPSWLWFPHPGQSACCWNPMPDFTTPMNPLLPSTRFHVPSLLAFAVTPNLQVAPTVPPQQEAWPCSRSKASSSERVQPGHAHQQTDSGLWKSSHYRNGKSSAIAVPGQLSSTVMLSGFICQEFFLSIKNNSAHQISTW